MSRLFQGVQSYDDAARLVTELAVDRVNQRIDLFNEKSGYAFMLTGMTSEGDTTLRKFVKSIRTLAHYRRDPNSTSARASVSYAEGEHVSVKVGGGFGPLDVPASALMWVTSKTDPSAEVQEALVNLADQYADAYLQDQLNTAIASLAAAMEGNSAILNDQSAVATKLDQLKINKTIGKFGDRKGNIKLLVMHSSADTELVSDAISNANALDTVGGVTINTGKVASQGRMIIYTDSPALSYHDGTRDVFKVLCLVPGAAEVSVIKQISSFNRSSDKDNIVDTYQANYDFKVGLKGYSWDISAGGVAPSDAALATAVNWPMVTTSYKDTAGTCLICQDI
jgi:hypothetical protein